MSAFRTMIDSVGRGEDGGVMYPETFLDDIGGAYDADFAGATAETAGLQARIAELEGLLQQSQAANWQLLQQVQAGQATIPDEPNVEENTDDTEDSEDDDPDTEDFFKSADK